MGTTREGAAESIARARTQLNEMQRARLGPVEAIGDLIVAIGVPVLLWNDAPPVPLLAWGLIVALSAYVWEVVNKAHRDHSGESDNLLTWFGWFTTITWAVLPWLAWPSLDDRGVVWILVFVVVFGVAADTLFVTQTSAVSVDEMVLVYVASFLIAFASHGQIAAIIATLAAGTTFIIGGVGLGEVTGGLVAQRLESERRSRVDPLTGIGTRLAASEALAEMLAAEPERIYCAFFDLDDFKQLNDNYGYDIGDAALRIVASLLVKELPSGWMIARFGGDEFVAIGPSAPDLERTNEVHLTLPTHGNLVLTQPLSVGLTSVVAIDATADLLFKEGASALRAAKRSGKRQLVVMTNELREQARAHTVLSARVGRALEQGHIVPWAQPIVELHNQRIVGLEILARWPQSDGSMVLPDDFIPIIEDQGAGPALGLLMIQHAIDALAWPHNRNSSVYVSVNLSARHLFQGRLPAEVRDMLAAAKVPPHRLVLEITESQHLPSSPIWGETARQLRDLGVGLALDDFGTGYSSMDQLLSMPFSHLKVDRLITKSVSRPGGAQMASAIVAMATGSGMVTIAEGIETVEQKSTMQDLGYRFGQGFLFARPAPLDVAMGPSAWLGSSRQGNQLDPSAVATNDVGDISKSGLA